MVDIRFNASAMARWLSPCCIVVLFLFPRICQASKISLELSVEVNKNDNAWSGHVNIANKGDEAAYDLQATLKAVGKEESTSIVKKLEVGKTWEAEIPIPEATEPQIMPGRYPATLYVFYSDANGHPFSALSVTFFEFGQASVSQINATLQATPVSDVGKLILGLQNMDQTPIEADVKWVFPRELVPDRSEEKIKINGRDSVTVRGRVRNLSALAGSQYPVFAIIEYDKDRRHFTSKAMATLSVVGPISFISSNRVPLFVLLGILVAAIILLQLRHRRSGKSM